MRGSSASILSMKQILKKASPTVEKNQFWVPTPSKTWGETVSSRTTADLSTFMKTNFKFSN